MLFRSKGITLLVFLLLISVRHAYATYTLLGHAEIQASGNTSITATGLDTTGADLIVVVTTSWANVQVDQVSDNKGNTWIDTTSAVSDGATYIHISYVQGASIGGTGHNITIQNPHTGFPSAEIMWFSGSASNPVDQLHYATFNASSFQTGSVTPSEDNELVIVGITLNNSSPGAPTVNSGFSSPAFGNDFSSGNAFGGYASYLIQGTAGAVNPTWTFGSGIGGAAQTVTFKAAAGSPPPPPPTTTSTTNIKIHGKVKIRGHVKFR